jgi:flagellar basal-body rod protein FlgG
MPKGIYAAASAMFTERQALDVVAQNVANANTAGYRRAEPLRRDFATLLADQGRTGGLSGDGGAGVQVETHWRSFADGLKRETGSPFDLALTGEGFYTVQGPEGETLLTRAGNFTANDQSQLVNAQGWPVLGQGGAIELPVNARSYTVDDAGRVYAQVPAAEGLIEVFVDQLRVVKVDDTDDLKERNGQYFDPGTTELRDADNYRVSQGYVESGNVESVTELVKMIDIQRRYDAAQRALKAQDKAGEGFSDILRGS